MGNKIQRVKTSISEQQMAQAIISGWRSMFGSVPSKEQVAMVIAQNDLETGKRKSMYNYNIGNITTDGKGQYDYYDDLTTNEQVKPGTWVKKNLKYRAYDSLDDGVKDYLKLLSGGRYSKAWQHILNPDPVEYSKALKEAGYYTANEAPYTKALTNLFKQNSKSNSYEAALSNKSEKLNMPNPSVMDLLNDYLKQIYASDKLNKKIYKKALPENHLVIKITAENYTDAIEFSRILCAALDEELMAKAFTHTDENNIEVDCTICGPSKECYETVKQLTASLTEVFKIATVKIGQINISANCIMNKRSSYQPISLDLANTQYRKFLLKFV